MSAWPPEGPESMSETESPGSHHGSLCSCCWLSEHFPRAYQAAATVTDMPPGFRPVAEMGRTRRTPLMGSHSGKAGIQSQRYKAE